MNKLILIIFLISICKNVYSIDLNNIFESSFYTIEFTSNNIEDDKINEISKLKLQSFLFILSNILTEKDYLKLENYITENLINTFIKNIVINDEKIIDNNYISNIKINYDKNKIINFLRLKKIPYVDYHPDKLLLIIYEKNKISNNLFTKNNSYYQYLQNNLKDNSLFIIPNLDINDRYILKEEDIVNRDIIKINNFFKKYNSDENIIIISDINKDKVTYNLTLYSYDYTLEKQIEYKKKEINVFINNLESEVLDLWKQINNIQNEKLNILNCRVNYFNMLELKEIRNNLNKISIINDLNVKKLSYKNIEYSINYYGTFKILSKLFKLNNLKLNYTENSCIIKL